MIIANGEFMKALTPAERQRRHRALKTAKGLVKVEVWVPANTVAQVKKLEQKLNKVLK
jgi:hypothetical protein